MPVDVEPVAEITKKNISLDPETNTYQFDDEAALKLVLDDTKTADAWMNINSQWAAGWTQSIILQQSPQSSFDGIGGLTVPKFTLSNDLSAVIPKAKNALFYEDPFFLLRPRPGTTQDTVRGKTALFAYQFDQMHFIEEVEAGWEQKGLLGTGIWKRGWASYKKKVKKYKRKSERVPVDTPFRTAHVDTPGADDFEIEIEEKDVQHPWFNACDIRTVLVDTGCRRGDIQKAKQVIYRDYATWSDLEHLRDVDGYDIPDEATLRSFFLDKRMTPPGDNLAMTLPEGMRGYIQQALPRNYKTTADPLQQGLEILERWDKEKVIVVLRHEDHNILIRNEPNPYGKIPFYSSNWRNLTDCFYGQGLGQLVGSEQMVEQGVVALALGMLAYSLQPTAVRKKGFNAISQPTRWEQGGIIDVEEDVDKAFKFLEFPQVPSEAWQMINVSKAAAEETSGANQQTTMGVGAPGVKTTGMRSGSGAQLVGQANASRLDGPVERFITQVFIPFLADMDEMNNDRLPTSILNEVLGEQLGKAYKVDHITFRNAQMEYEVLAGAHLGPKKEMAQFMPFLQQLFNNPTLMELLAEQGYWLDVVAWFKQFCDLAGFKYSQDFLKPMTAEQKQIHMANSPAGVAQRNAANAQRLEAQKFAQDQQKIDQEQLGKGANEAQRLMLEKVLDSEVLQAPQTSGFGTETPG